MAASNFLPGLLYFFGLLSLALCMTRARNFRQERNKRWPHENATMTTAVSKINCAAGCKEEDSCAGANYHRREGCELIRAAAVNPESDFVEAADWTVICKCLVWGHL